MRLQHKQYKLQPLFVRLQPKKYKLQPFFVRLQPKQYKLQPLCVRLQPKKYKLQPLCVRLQPKQYKLQPLFVRLQPKQYKLTPTTLAETCTYLNCFHGNFFFFFRKWMLLWISYFLVWRLCYNMTYEEWRSGLSRKISESIDFIFLPETCWCVCVGTLIGVYLCGASLLLTASVLLTAGCSLIPVGQKHNIFTGKLRMNHTLQQL